MGLFKKIKNMFQGQNNEVDTSLESKEEVLVEDEIESETEVEVET